MPAESTGTTALTGTSAEDQAAINELLGTDAAETEKTTTETEHQPGTHTEVEKPAPAKESEEAPAETEEATEEEAETEEATEEAEEEESEELSIEDGDRDYSQAAYEKAAKHYSKTLGVQLNPDDPAHRALLKENMDRGEALKQLTAKQEADKAKPEEVKAVEETKPAEVRAATPEQIEEGLKTIYDLAKQRNVPQVATANASRLVKALWPNEDIKLSQEQANDINSTLHGMFLQALDDALPFLFQGVNNNMAADPVWGPARSEAVDARAFEHLDKTKGAEWYASMETLVDNGTIKKVIAENPQIFKNIRAGDGKDPVLNRAAQLEAAFKIARGDQTIQQVTRAVETGKKKATDLAKKIAAGRVSAGTPKSGFNTGKSEGGELVRNITQGGGSKFSAAVKSQLHK